MENANILCLNFQRQKTEEEGLTDFFAALDEMDSHIQFLPITKLEVMSPAYSEDKIDYFDAMNYVLQYVKRAASRKVIKRIDIDSLLAEREDIISPFIEELIAMRDVMFSCDKSGIFFVTDEAFRDFAKLTKLSGDALKHASPYRDDYIASLLADRCSVFAKKREPKPAFTAVAFEECGIRRVIAARSGGYRAIPQSTLKTVFQSMMEKDDWGAVECRDWFINHDISYVDLEFPDVAKDILAAYPGITTLPVIPGVRLSTGSTGINSLKVTMTWRLIGSSSPAMLEEVSQKHCNTYEGEAFIEKVHQNIWDKYGELPERLAELYTIPLDKKSRDSYIRSLVDSLHLNKIFMQKETPKTEKANYVEQIINNTQVVIDAMEDPTAYDLAIELMGATDKLDLPESYGTALRAALMKAPYCDAFTKLIEKSV